ncbi:hypothetical protein JHK86_006592 [Glycine max]|nr:hypothetical protein JHK86_006592 [Glycine max]
MSVGSFPTSKGNKKHETVKVFCKPCKPGQGHEYAQELARLSGGIPLQIIGDDTIIFDCGKNYEQPEVMSPIDTLSKNKARIRRGDFFVHETYGAYKSVEELWDGEI